MTNHTVPVRLTNAFLAAASPILDDATDYPPNGGDRYMVALAPVVAKIAAADTQRDWSVTIDVTADEAAILKEEAEYRLTFDFDSGRDRREIEQLVDRLTVAIARLAPFQVVAEIEVSV